MKKVASVAAKLSLLLLMLLSMLLITACQPDAQPAAARISGLRLDNILGNPDAAGFAYAVEPRDFVFPKDHGQHTGYRSEWWYLTAVLEDDEGVEYGVHFTLFRQALSPAPTGEGPWHTGQAYLGHLAITDTSTGTHFEAERFARGHPALAGVTTEPGFHALIEDWSLKGASTGYLDLTLTAAQRGQFAVDLQIEQTGPIVLQGNHGLSKKGPDAASYYYSIPRLKIGGTLNLGGRAVRVKGLGWLDREWSTSVLGESLAGWDWFSLQLNDDRSIMAFRLRRHDGERDPFDHGLLVDHPQLESQLVADEADPGVELLDSSEFSLTPTRFYQDSRGIEWPVSWRLHLAEEVFTINALLDQQTVDLSIIYWEGLVEILDAEGARSGLGYMELTGYEPAD